MRFLKLAAVALGLAVLLAPSPSPSPAAEPRQLRIEGKKWEWIPSRVQLKVGETVEITFVSSDVKHGVACRDLGLAPTPFDRDRPAVVRVTPTRAGTFPFKCSHLCGKGHRRMVGEFVVVP